MHFSITQAIVVSDFIVTLPMSATGVPNSLAHYLLQVART